MKNMSKILAITALLLVFVMMFAACSENENPASEPNDVTNSNNKQDETEPYVPHNKVNVMDKVNKWTEYIEFDDESIEEIPTLEGSFIESTGNVDGTVVKINGWLIVTTSQNVKQIIDKEDPNAEPVLVATLTDIKIISTVTGEEMMTLKKVIPEVDADGKCLGTYAHTMYVSYTVSAVPSIQNGLVISKTTKSLRELEDGEEALDITKNTSYEATTTYTYYDGEANVVYENAKEMATFRQAHNFTTTNRSLMDVDDKTLLLTYEGELVKSFARGNEYNIPYFSEYSLTSTGLTNDYAYVTAGEYQYIIKEPAPIMQRLGELTLYTVQGISLTVMDEDYNAIVEYSTDCYHLAGYAILPNGNVYICEYVQLPSSATEYDFIKGEIKFNIKHTLVDVTEKAVKDLDLSFIATSMFTNVTGDIKSFTNQAVVTSMAGTCKIKDGYVLATVQKYANQTLEANTSYAILDNSLQIVAEFDSILPSQLSYPSFIDADTLLVTTRAIDEKVVNYAVELSDGSVSLFAHDLTKVDFLEYGYYLNNKIYDKNWKVLYDFYEGDMEYRYLATINGKVYVTTGATYDNECIYVYEDYSGSCYWEFVCDADDRVIFHDTYFECVDDNGNSEYRSIGGDLLYSERSYISKTYYDDNGNSAYYTGTEEVETDGIVPNGDGSYLVTAKQYYVITHPSGTHPSTRTETVYYLFK